MRFVAIITIILLSLTATSLAADPPRVAVPPTKAAADMSKKLDEFIAVLRRVEAKTGPQEEAARFSWWKHK